MGTQDCGLRRIKSLTCSVIMSFWIRVIWSKLSLGNPTVGYLMGYSPVITGKPCQKLPQYSQEECRVLLWRERNGGHRWEDCKTHQREDPLSRPGPPRLRLSTRSGLIKADSLWVFTSRLLYAWWKNGLHAFTYQPETTRPRTMHRLTT